MNQAHYLWHYLFSLPYLCPNCQLRSALPRCLPCEKRRFWLCLREVKNINRLQPEDAYQAACRREFLGEERKPLEVLEDYVCPGTDDDDDDDDDDDARSW